MRTQHARERRSQRLERKTNEIVLKLLKKRKRWPRAQFLNHFRVNIETEFSWLSCFARCNETSLTTMSIFASMAGRDAAACNAISPWNLFPSLFQASFIARVCDNFVCSSRNQTKQSFFMYWIISDSIKRYENEKWKQNAWIETAPTREKNVKFSFFGKPFNGVCLFIEFWCQTI